jgi:AcrR family transcriptional regulator
VAGRSRVTREAILATAARIITQTGAASLTFQTLGETLGVTKQAIIYWFPSKSDLARELIVPALELEADAVASAVEGATSARDAIELFLRALVAFHSADLGRFRMIYVAAQFDPETWQVSEVPKFSDRIHVATSRMYGALEAVLQKAPDLADPAGARRAAVATHMAGIGALTMLSLADVIDDPLAHPVDKLVDTLVALTLGQLLRQL